MMVDKFVVTVVESVYLIYMFFIYKTTYRIQGAHFEKETQSLGSYFVHDTGRYENKICLFGKIMAILAIILAVVRLYFLTYYPEIKSRLVIMTLGFDSLCLFLAASMNLNALVYLLPILVGEAYILFTLT